MLKLEGVSKYFSKRKIIHSIDLIINKPLIYGLLGPNGAGKTTTIRMICGIIDVDSGNIYRDKNFNLKSIGYMPEEAGLYKDMSILDEILYFGRLHNISKEKTLLTANPLIEQFKLSNELNKPVSALSKGTSRKVQFICTLIHEPQFIILDEPFSGLDPLSSEIMEKELLKLKSEGKTIVLSTHRMEHAEIFCDHIFIINNGKMILDETLQNIKANNMKNSYEIHVLDELKFETYVDYFKTDADTCFKYIVKLDNNFTYKQLISTLSGNKILFFKQETPTLKEIFLHITSKK